MELERKELGLDWVGIKSELLKQSVEVDDICESLNDGGLREDSEERLREATSIRDVIPILQQEERDRGQDFIGRVLHELIGRVPKLKHGILPFLPELMEMGADLEMPLEPPMVPVQVTEAAHQGDETSSQEPQLSSVHEAKHEEVENRERRMHATLLEPVEETGHQDSEMPTTTYDHSQLLLQCGDVETNPGPDGDFTMINEATIVNPSVRECDFKDIGCQFKGNVLDHAKYLKEELMYHNQLMKKANKELEQTVETQMANLDRQLATLNSDVAQIRSELTLRVQPLADTVARVETTVQQLQEGFNEMALMVQTLQATSYNGTFIWKIPEIQRRRHEAMLGRTISLYSAPFYTSRHGYKMCLRLYIEGDGSGKGSHLSFFITLMRGEYDWLLGWPFKQTVTLLLLDQDKRKDLVKSFQPESSFKKLNSKMNVASGCPLLALGYICSVQRLGNNPTQANLLLTRAPCQLSDEILSIMLGQ